MIEAVSGDRPGHDILADVDGGGSRQLVVVLVPEKKSHSVSSVHLKL